MKTKPTVLILGITGMLGQTLFKVLSQSPSLVVIGTARSKSAKEFFSAPLRKNIRTNVQVDNFASLEKIIATIQPDVIINCVGVVKQKMNEDAVLETVPINSLLPHQLSQVAKKIKARLILISTDCVFSGKRGNYKESDAPDCNDLYGRSKLLGEITHSKDVLTIRTSIIGPELNSKHGLLDWFLSQKGAVYGYTNAIFSVLPTHELSAIIRDLILPNKKLCGLFHISAAPISKYELLNLIAKVYAKKIKIIKHPEPKLNRALNCDQFKRKTGYTIKDWKTLVNEMHQFEK